MIPIYRAKKMDSDEYVDGYYYREDNGTTEHMIVKDGSPMFMYQGVDPSTLSIHFPDMLDSDGNKIFASLIDDGKGGDKVSVPYITPFGELTKDEDYQSTVIIKNGTVQLKTLNQRAIREMMLDTTDGEYISNFGNPVVFGTHAIFKVIGIQQ